MNAYHSHYEYQHIRPSTLYLWWVHRPLAAAQAVIFAQTSAHRVHYVRHPFYRESDCGVTSVNYDFHGLLARRDAPTSGDR
jgi:adenine-specific DNA methylase